MSELIQENIELKNKNWLKVGGPAQYFAEPKNISELKEVVSWTQIHNHPITILGDGSNILIHDEGIQGLVLSDKNFNQIHSAEVKGDRFVVNLQSGVPKSKAMRAFLKQKLSPALFLSGLPGNIGGGVIMNAGVSEKRTPREFVEIVDEFTIFEYESGELKTYKNQDIKWSYRKTEGYKEGFITDAVLSWPLEPIETIPQEVMEANKLRLSKQPLDLPSCGSVFKNPEGDSSGRLIEDCGLKGHQIGGAQISTKHANFIVNIDNAKASDIFQLIQKAQSSVLERHGVRLHPEVRLLGPWSSDFKK